MLEERGDWLLLISSGIRYYDFRIFSLLLLCAIEYVARELGQEKSLPCWLITFPVNLLDLRKGQSESCRETGNIVCAPESLPFF